MFNLLFSSSLEARAPVCRKHTASFETSLMTNHIANTQSHIIDADMASKQHTNESGHVTPSRKYALDTYPRHVYDGGVSLRLLVTFLVDRHVAA